VLATFNNVTITGGDGRALTFGGNVNVMASSVSVSERASVGNGGAILLEITATNNVWRQCCCGRFLMCVVRAV
jgi:predicted outer membrane repeat protein